MKKLNYFLMICLLATSVGFFSGCDRNSDDPNNPNVEVPDPTGTITVTMRNGNNGTTIVMPDNCYNEFCINGSNNFQTYGFATWKFATIGSTKGLGNVTQIPSAGWAPQVAVAPGNGYVGASFGYLLTAQTAKVTYVRLYVTKWITSTAGGIIGAEVKYQSPFSFTPDADKITMSEDVINLPNTNGYSVYPSPITITPFNANWSVTSSVDWCKVETTDVNSFKIYYQDNFDYSTYNYVPRTATLTIKVEGLPDKTITVRQGF